MSEWRETNFGEVIDVINGFAFKSANFLENMVTNSLPVIKIKNVANGNVHLNGVQYHAYSENLSKYIVKKDDVLIALTGNHPQAESQVVGLTSRYKLDCTALINQRVAKVISKNEETLSTDYIYYFLKDTNTHLYLASRSSGSANQANISKSDIENIPFSLPPENEQKAIAAVLSSLDDKIDLLHCQNKTLEAMAETLFKQWFVVEAQEDWGFVELGNYVNCFNGVSYKSSDLNPSKIAMVTLKSFDRNGGFRLDGFKEFTGKYKEQHVVKQGDLVVAHTDITQDAEVIGNPVLVVSDSNYNELIISMDLVKVTSKYEWLSNEFLYRMMRTREFKQHCLGCSNGSTVLHLNKQAIPSYEFFLPPENKIREYTVHAKSVLEKKFKNIAQIQTLETLRDNLLPKLMSGEVRVKY